MWRKAATDRLKPIARHRSFIRPLGERIVRWLADRPAAPDGAAEAYRLVLEHLRAELLALEGRLEGAENAYDGAKIRLKSHRDRRDRARAKLECHHRRIREFLTAFFPPQVLARAGIAAVSGPKLAHHSTLTIGVLNRIEILGPPILEVSFSARALAAELQDALDELDAATAGLELARAAVAGSRLSADQAIAEVDRTAPWIRRCLECLGHLAGRSELARRIRRR